MRLRLHAQIFGHVVAARLLAADRRRRRLARQLARDRRRAHRGRPTALVPLSLLPSTPARSPR